MRDGEEVALRVAPRRALADEWALVLVAEGLHPSVHGQREGFAVCVTPGEAERAAVVLATWERENRTAAAEPPRPESLDAEAIPHALASAAALLAFFVVTGPRRGGGTRWFAAGSAEAERLLDAEPWRAVTALTLHADAAHAAGNAVAGSLFFAGVFRAFGFGAGALLVLAAGAGGNLLNAWLHGSRHVVVGASTAVFGALGLLAGRALFRGRARGLRGRAAFVPVAAALALLAMIGTEGERVDLWAHAAGLLAGSLLGALAARAPAALESRLLQRAAGLATLAFLVGAWWLALGSP
jgi:membrane associated rhomboid family serine protease